MVCTGGDVFSEDYGWRSFLWQVGDVAVSLMLEKRVLLLAHTIGPFRGHVKPIILKFLFDRVEVVALRDTMSANVLIRMGTDVPVRITADPAFVLPASEEGWVMLEESGQTQGLKHPIVGISVSDAKWG